MGSLVSKCSRSKQKQIAQEILSSEYPVLEYCVGSHAVQNDDQSMDNYFTLIGEHENQVSEGGEADLHTHLANCKKNPGHPEFIPIQSFSLDHLPEGHRDSDLFNFIKSVGDLTVRLSVTMTSPRRPEFWPNTKIPYFLYELRGKETLRTGTGRMCDVRKYTGKDKQWNYTTCPCDECAASDKPNNVWWRIEVVTAAHVVFDDIEASHTTLRLFYDSEDSELVILNDKLCIYDVSVERDCCKLTCVTCDKNLGNKLKITKKHFKANWEKVFYKYLQSRDIAKVNFLVSHPHGCSKQVSVGRWVDKVHVGRYFNDTKFTYTTCTCPGSSGAYVHSVGYTGMFNAIVHCGNLESGLSCSGFGRIF